MVILYHNNNRIIEVVSDGNHTLSFNEKVTIADGLMQLAVRFPESVLVWCHQNLKEQLHVSAVESLFHHKKLLLSYNPSDSSFIDSSIGYIDTSLFVEPNKKVTFATWQMSSAVGGVPAAVLLALDKRIPLHADFDYFLCSLAKLAMPKGLLCYSEPQLLKGKVENLLIKTSSYTLFRFAKQHYKIQWVFLLLLNLFLFERQFPLFPFFFSLFYKNRSKTTIDLAAIIVKSTRNFVDQGTLDVIIPTIGRKDYLFDFLNDLKKQTHLPTNVIIVEQNPVEGSESELDYLTNEKWPFVLKHIFTHQLGACNARNIALKQIVGEWVFFADDDIRIDGGFVQKTLEQLNNFGAKAVSIRCDQKGQRQIYTTIFQWISFGSGCSFVLAGSLKNCVFNMGYEFGFGEDSDFGMQLRNKGNDVLYFPEPEILHLKAPMGGFRTKPVLPWHYDSIQPKPSPTIMLYQMLHSSKAKTNSYKTTLFFKYYGLQKIKNPLRYYFNFQKQWDRSVFWAKQLKQQNEI